ncbi:MAG TPA: SPOR domain-containing protein [Phycisphaerales bacterium]|nr:SPOR domain-containing protein [Phycisphaerales bacterium]
MLTRPLHLIFAIAFTLASIGCSTNGPKAMERSIEEYNQGQWSISAMWARKALNENGKHDEAAYLLGLCEFRMQHIPKAKEWFEQVATSQDKEVRGKATAMLGIIASNSGDYVTAALAFEQATNDLKGSDKTKASSRAATTGSGSPFSETVISGAYTLQFGAYKNLENAQNAANKIGSNLRLAGLGNATIVEEKSKIGKALFMVRAGSFETRASAARCRNRNALPQCIVTAVQ